MIKKRPYCTWLIKRFSFSVLFVLCQLISVAQLDVDSIKNDKDVIKFIEYFGAVKNQQWKRVSLNYKDKLFLKYTSKDDITILDSVARQKWVVADFNGDGKKDLIVACKIYTQFKILGFVSFEKNGFSFDSCFYSLVNLSTEYSTEYPSGIYKIENGGLLKIRLLKYQRSYPRKKLSESFSDDTLVYKISTFVEYNKAEVGLAKFDSIVFRRNYTWDPQPPLLKLYADGKFLLFSKEYGFGRDTSDWKQGVFVSAVGQNSIRLIEDILGYINFQKLESSYKVLGVTDLPRFRTEVYYNGKKKVIDDYGGQGTYGLRLLYKELIRLKVLRQPEIN